MKTTKAVIEDAQVHSISDLFRKKPPGLGFNETDALVLTIPVGRGKKVNATFYMSLKPDGTFEEETMGSDASKSRRHRLASFLRYYGITKDVSTYNLRDGAKDLKGRDVEIVPTESGASVYIP